MRHQNGLAKVSVSLASVALIMAIVCPALSASSGPPNDSPANSIVLRDGWRLQTSVLAGENGEPISRPDFKTDGWYAASVPTTVLNALVRNSVYPDPYVGMNNMRIPDASDEFNRAVWPGEVQPSSRRPESLVRSVVVPDVVPGARGFPRQEESG